MEPQVLLAWLMNDRFECWRPPNDREEPFLPMRLWCILEILLTRLLLKFMVSSVPWLWPLMSLESEISSSGGVETDLDDSCSRKAWMLARRELLDERFLSLVGLFLLDLLPIEQLDLTLNMMVKLDSYAILSGLLDKVWNEWFVCVFLSTIIRNGLFTTASALHTGFLLETNRGSV